jgi:hypothetical protein
MGKQDSDRIRCVSFVRCRDNTGRVEWEYRCDGVGMLKYMVAPPVGDTARVIFKSEIPHDVQERFTEALRKSTDRWFAPDGWMVNLSEGIMQEIDKYLDDVLAAETERAEENERLWAWKGKDDGMD